ncbi:MAG: KpsF/GutQ family sugar-phosphate isomerase [Planctomycetaceae bacterium]|nr:KpsF/GutQ family sugar-phosphate isomerase [Planctomycetaceae bacterium]
MHAEDNGPDILPSAALAILQEAGDVIRQEAAALHQMADALDASFCDAVRLVERCTGGRPAGRVMVTGVGKAGLIGQKIVATLASTGTRAGFLHPTEAVHGDLGCVGPDDCVLALSNSGASEEILRLLPVLARLQVPVIAITRDADTPLARAAEVTLAIGRHSEAGRLKLAPSTSTTAMLAMGDALSLVLSSLRGFGETDFALFHPAGSLGRRLQPVHEVMRTDDDLRVAQDSVSVRQVMIELSRPGRRTGAVVLTDASGQLTGLFTDSDLARLFEQRRDHQIDEPISAVMTVNPTTIGPDALLPEAVSLLSERKISELPVVDEDRRPVGLVDITDVMDCLSFAASRPVTDAADTQRSAVRSRTA